MEKKFIKELLDLIAKTDVAELRVEKPDLKIVIKKKSAFNKVEVVDRHYSGNERQSPPVLGKHESYDSEDSHEIRGLVPIKSPIVGTFYAAPSPGSDNYVSVGDKVKKGQVLCIIEAMKLMNEIESDIDGTVVELMVENGQPVEYGEVIFLLEPLGSS